MKKFIILFLFIVGVASKSFAYSYYISSNDKNPGSFYKVLNCSTSSIHLFLEVYTNGGYAKSGAYIHAGSGITKQISTSGNERIIYSKNITDDSISSITLYVESYSDEGCTTFAHAQVGW